MDRPALLAALLTAMLWGLTGTFVYLLPTLSPFYITGVRLLVGLLCVLPCLGFMPTLRRQFAYAATQPIAYAFAALLTTYYLCATSGFKFAPVAEVALLLSVSPLFVLLLRRIEGDVPARMEVGGAVFAMLGLAWILAPRLLSSETANSASAAMPGVSSLQHLFGDLLAIGAAACTAIYAHIYKRITRSASVSTDVPAPLGVTLLTLLLGSIALLLLAPVIAAPLPDSLSTDQHTWWMLLGLGVLSTGIPSLSFAIASQRLPPLMTATVFLLMPVFTALFAAIFLGQILPLSMLPGSLVLLGGVGLMLYGSAGER